MNWELLDVRAGLRKGRTRDQIANICWIMEKAREFHKNNYFCFIDNAKAFDCVAHNKLKNSYRHGSSKPPYLPPEKPVWGSRSNSYNQTWKTDWFKIEKEYYKALYCHPAYLTYMQSTSCDAPGWINHKLESRLTEKYQQPQFCSCVSLFVTPPGSSVHGILSWSKNTGVGSHSFFQGISLTQGLKPGLLHCRQILFCLNHQGSSINPIGMSLGKLW